MDNYIKAVEEIGFKHTKAYSSDLEDFKQKGVELTLIESGESVSILTEKSRHGILNIGKEFNIYRVSESQLPLAIRATVRFWAKNGVKLAKEKK